MLLLDKKTENLVREYIPHDNNLSAMSDFFSALSDSTRIKIISALSVTPMCVTDLSRVLNVNQTTLSHALNQLKNLNVVKSTRQGKIIFYSIKHDGVLELMLTAVNFI